MPKVIFTKEHQHTVDKLKKARERSGLDQASVARVLGKSQSYISKIESGQRRIDISILQEFARIYKRTINYFINE